MKSKFNLTCTAHFLAINEQCENTYTYDIEAESKSDAEGIAKLRVLEDFSLDLNSFYGDDSFQLLKISIDNCQEL